MMITYLYLFFPLQKKSEHPIFRVVKAQRRPISPRMAGKFCLRVGNQANKRADGTMDRAEPQPITEDEFCVLGNLLKIQNCYSAAHISVILMTLGFSFKTLHNLTQYPLDCWCRVWGVKRGVLCHFTSCFTQCFAVKSLSKWCWKTM